MPITGRILISRDVRTIEEPIKDVVEIDEQELDDRRTDQ